MLESLNKLEINTTCEISPRTKQNLYKNEIEKVLRLFFYIKILIIKRKMFLLNGIESHAFSLKFQILQFQNEIQNLRKYNEVNEPYKVSSQN